jgi:transposase
MTRDDHNMADTQCLCQPRKKGWTIRLCRRSRSDPSIRWINERRKTTRPTMRVVPVTSATRHAALLDRKTRDFLVRQRAQVVNTIRAHLPGVGPCGPRLGRNAPPERFIRACPHRLPSCELDR